jgi:hypothetical protein
VTARLIRGDRTVIQISRPVYDQLTAIQRQRQDTLKRKVSYTEIIEDLLEHMWVNVPAAVTDAWARGTQSHEGEKS